LPERVYSLVISMSVDLNIHANRKSQKYSRKELCLRVLWGFGKFAFRFSPRICFGFRRWLLRCFGAKVGNNVNIYPSAIIYYPWNLEVGHDSAIGEWTLIYNLGKVTIGQRTTVSQRVHLCAGTHDYRKPDMPLVKPPIIIGDEVWLCADAFIGPNVQIGNRAIVAAASVVSKDVEQGKIVGGNPAKFIKERD
jgi:putative colanic acid biosynthesis acetyltransferase WcaF